MPIRHLKPTSPGRRGASVADFGELSKKGPERKLTVILKKKSGRNNQGKITVRHQGGGHKRRYRFIDFRQQRFDQEVQVLSLEYDPNRNARIALVQYTDGVKSYILAPEGLRVGSIVLSSQSKIEAQPGNRMPLKFIPAGMDIHNIEFFPMRGGQLVRSAGMRAVLMSHEDASVNVKLPSGEIRRFLSDCAASVGMMSNADARNVRLGKAGRMRHRGVRPRVRGKAMNPVDHPHGGGEGNQPVGIRKGPKNVWGKLAMGVRTRKRTKKSNRFIVQRRNKS